jgi:hypothetical protein
VNGLLHTAEVVCLALLGEVQILVGLSAVLDELQHHGPYLLKQRPPQLVLKIPCGTKRLLREPLVNPLKKTETQKRNGKISVTLVEA